MNAQSGRQAPDAAELSRKWNGGVESIREGSHKVGSLTGEPRGEYLLQTRKSGGEDPLYCPHNSLKGTCGFN